MFLSFKLILRMILYIIKYNYFYKKKKKKNGGEGVGIHETCGRKLEVVKERKKF